jgi:hypothetical protein
LEGEDGVIVEPWQVQWNGLTMGDGTPYVVQSMNLGTAPDIRATDHSRGRQHGARLGEGFSAKRIITGEIEIGRDMADDVYEAFVQACNPVEGAEGILYGNVPGIAGSNEWMVRATLRNRSLPTDQDYAAGIGHAQLEWHAGDPRFYSTAQQSYETTTESSDEIGLAFPAEFPLSFGAAVVSGRILTSNVGNVAAPWQATIYGPVSSPYIELVGTGRRLTLNAEIGAGEWVTLDSDTGAVLYMGEVGRRSWLGTYSRWFSIPKGGAALRYGAAAEDGSRLVLTYRSAWT